VTGSDIPTEPSAPVLRIVNADATAEEVAAIVAVFSALGAPTAPAPRPVSRWAAQHRLRTPVHAGRGGWRASGLPR
jgi:hypothetical protein